MANSFLPSIFGAVPESMWKKRKDECFMGEQLSSGDKCFDRRTFSEKFDFTGKMDSGSSEWVSSLLVIMWCLIM